ncbi:MAG: type IV secretory system conjugative DNA transfer family protein [Solirubrobacteraceae bacterium]
MRSDAPIWYRLRWPREVTPEQVAQVFRLLATAAGTPVVIEAVGSPGAVEHRVALPASRAEVVVDQLRAAIPGLSVEELSGRPPMDVSHAVALRLSTKRRPLRSDDLAGTCRAILTALAHLHRGEHLSIQWVLGRSLAAVAVPNHLEGLGRESWIGALLLAPLGNPPQADVELRNAVRAKQAEPGWRAVGHVSVKAKTASRERQLIRQVVGALGSAEAPGVRFWVRRASVKRVIGATAGWRLPMRLNATELAAVSSWPIGMTGELPVSMIGSRLIAPSAAIPRKGRVIGTASFPGRERPVALSPVDSLRHLHLLGPTGVGKSTLLLNLITQDMQAGRAVVVIEPKGDLIADVLERIPPERIGDVVLLDPTDTERPVGLNPLALGGRSPELVADQLLGLFHSLYAAHWGPRTHDIFGASLLTLARLPGMSLAALPLLLTDAKFRRQVVPRVADPIGLEPFWSGFEAWSETERATAIAPVMNKLRPLLLRPELRAIIGQSRGFDLHRVFTERKILLVNLSKGLLGPETSALLGSLVISQLWQGILGRAAITPERRHPVFVYVDEFQDYLHLPLDFSDALAQARGLGVGFALAHQYMHQLDPAMRSAVLANAQSRIAFRLPSEDARVIAAGSSLDPEDFVSLGAFQCYAQAVAQGAIRPWCSLRTLPPSQPLSDPAIIRAASRGSYGTDRAAVEAELHQLLFGRRSTDDNDLAPRRRSTGGTQ